MRGRISRNFSINLVGAGVSVVVALVTVPLYIKSIGTDRYGVIALSWILLGYFGFLDLGLARAAANALARLHDQPRERAEVLSTALLLNIGFGLFGGLVMAIFGGQILDAAVTLSPELRSEAIGAMPWVAAMLPLALVNGVADGALESKERFFLANVIGIVGSACGQVIPVLLALFVSNRLDVLIPAAVMVRAVWVAVMLVFALAPEERLRLAYVKGWRIRELLSYGGWISISGLISPLLTTIDQIIIGRLMGPSAITHYAVPMNLVIRTQIFASALSRTLFPRLSRQSRTEATETAERAIVTLAFTFGGCCIIGMIFAQLFLAIWISPEFGEESGTAARILLLGGWINGLAFIPYALLQGQGRPDLTAKFHMLELLPYVLLLWGLSHRFGLTGAAMAWSLRVSADALLLAAATRISLATIGRIAIPGAALCLAFLFASWAGTSLTAAVAATVVLGAAMLALGAALDPFIMRTLRSAALRVSSP